MTEPNSVVSRSSASALHEILYAIKYADVQTIAQAWVRILDSEWRSLQFIQRHAEVVSLIGSVVSEIEALPAENTRNRLLPYVNSWWEAAISPNTQWEGNSPPRETVSQPDLDQLASLSDIISARFGGTAIAPLGEDLAILRTQCTEWVSLLLIPTK